MSVWREECSLVFPASVMNGVAVSKTFQILYRNEDVSVNDVVVFKVYMLVDSQRVSPTRTTDHPPPTLLHAQSSLCLHDQKSADDQFLPFLYCVI